MKPSELYIKKNSLGESFVINSQVACMFATLEGKIEEIEFLINMYKNTRKQCKVPYILSMLDIIVLDLGDRKKIAEGLLEKAKEIHKI